MARAQALVGDLGAGQGGHLGTLPKPTGGTGQPGGLPSMGSHRVGHD